MKLPEMKYILSEKKTSLNKIKNKLGTAEERTSEFERSNRNYVMKHRKSKQTNKHRFGYLGDKTKLSNIHVIEFQNEQRGEQKKNMKK